MNTMVEKLALAFLAMDPPEGDAMDGYRALARKALETMREPTEAMVNAGMRAYDGATTGQWASEGPIAAAFKAMLDAALTEGEG